jgi:hypothetical protein
MNELPEKIARALHAATCCVNGVCKDYPFDYHDDETSAVLEAIEDAGYVVVKPPERFEKIHFGAVGDFQDGWNSCLDTIKREKFVMHKRDIWVDFNTADSAGEVVTHLNYVSPGAIIEPGKWVKVADDEGTVCFGTVTRITDEGFVYILLAHHPFVKESE